MRDAAEEAIKVFQDWAVGVDYREDVYKAVKAYADTKPKLDGEDARLLSNTRCAITAAPGSPFRRTNGKEVEKLRKELAKLGDGFRTQHRRRESAGDFHARRSSPACRTACSTRPGSRPAKTPTPCSPT